MGWRAVGSKGRTKGTGRSHAGTPKIQNAPYDLWVKLI